MIKKNVSNVACAVFVILGAAVLQLDVAELRAQTEECDPETEECCGGEALGEGEECCGGSAIDSDGPGCCGDEENGTPLEEGQGCCQEDADDDGEPDDPSTGTPYYTDSEACCESCGCLHSLE